MNTNEYETFEYLQPNNEETISKRLFVLQDNGTYLSFDRSVDLSQVQNVELLEEVQPVYDVSPEQFYIDVDGSQEIITVSEQFVLSNELHNEEHMYENNIMLHESSSSNMQQTVAQIPENIVEQFIKKEPSNAEINIEMDTTPSNLTEVMLSDEQYKFLEQRGWTLVESNENIFFIDGLGLHNITNNDQLIQDLKEKMRYINESCLDNDTSNITETIIFEEHFENNEIEPSIPFIEEKKEKKEEAEIPKLTPIKILPKPQKKAKEVPDLMPSEREFLETTVNELSEKYENSDPRINNNTIKIKTKFSLKDIPSELVLGKTVNGKRLIARVTNRKRRDASKANIDSQRKDLRRSETNAFDQNIERLIQQAVCGEIPPVTDQNVIDNADRLIQQLLRVPAFKPAVIEKRLIITKISLTEDDEQNPKESGPILITGRVVNKGDDKWSFLYIPDMLQRIKENGGCEEGSKETRRNKGNRDVDVNFLQIHIQEVIGPDGCARWSITLNRRVILVKCKRGADNRDTDKPRVFSCDICAAIFKNECKLLQHKELHSVADNLKTVRPDAMYTTTNLGLNKTFKCNQCQFQTSTQSIIHRHIKSHFSSLIKGTEKPKDIVDEKYSCKLCSDSFTNATSLLKHIVSSHIKVIET